MGRKFVLASGSPRRRELLKSIGAQFTICVADVDESTVPETLEPSIYVQELAVLKASAAASGCEKHTLVIGADTVVVSGGKILGKPKDSEDAENMLRSLSGKSHFVYTGIAVADTDSMRIESRCEKTEVVFRDISDSEIKLYVKNCRPLDKAGAYGIQEFAAVFVKSVSGDYFNVVGLPLCRLYTLIKDEFGEELSKWQKRI